jgi:hypothetical protein
MFPYIQILVDTSNSNCFSCVGNVFSMKSVMYELESFQWTLIGFALFWDITQHHVVSIYRLFGTTYRPHLKGSGVLFFLDSWPLKMGLIRCPETLVNNYHTTPCNIPEECRTYQHHGGSLKLMEVSCIDQIVVMQVASCSSLSVCFTFCCSMIWHTRFE